jgi:GWxTD domain-containing protein
MHIRSSCPAILLGLALVQPATAAAQKLDKDDRKFLDEVRPIMLADEEKTFKALKDKADRLEFQKIFWARRDADLATPENQFQEEYAKRRAEADQKFRASVQSGSTTDCGRTWILLGKPDDVQEEASGSVGSIVPQTWTYRDRPGQTFQGGKAVIAFDADCRAPGGFSSQLDHIAATKVLHPNIDYRVGRDGRLTKLADLLPRDTAARALFKQPRQDFPLAVQPSYLKVADGGTALLGLVRGEAAGLAVAESGGAKTVNVSVAASAIAEDGKEAGWTEQTMNAPVGPDGAFLGSFKLGLRPGKYTVKAGVVDVKGGKASLASMPAEVPDYSKVEAAPDGTTTKVPTASVIVVKGVEELTATNPEHPLAAFELGRVRLNPVFGGIAHKADQVEFFYQVYDLKVDPATGKANAVATLAVLKDGKTPVAKAPPNPIETAFAGSSVGPIPLSNYQPGKYVVQLKVTDNVAKKDLVQEAPLEIVP